MDDATATPAAPALREAADLPGPRGLPGLGNLLQLKPAQLHRQLEAWSREHGAVYRLQLGSRRVMVVGDHEAIAAAMRDRPEGFRRTQRLEQVWTGIGLPGGVFGANGEAWQRQRRMVMAGFDPAHVRRYHPALQRVALRLHERWRRAARDGRAIDLQADLMRYTVDAVAGLAFGTEVDTLLSDGDVIQRHLDRLFPELQRRMLSPLPNWRWLRPRAAREFDASVAAIAAAVDGFIAAARARLRDDPSRREAPPNLLEAMLVAADSPGSGIDDATVAGNVLTMLLAGEDTTANTLAWMIHLLWRHPEALAAARDEVRRVTGGAPAPDFEALQQLDLVEACAHETMRLKPVAPVVGLQALRDSVVAGVRVPAGTVMLALMRHDAVDERRVPRAAQFDPSRWAPGGGSVAGAARRVSMPFGAGPRICPGRYLALTEMKMAMATLLGSFEIVDVGVPGGGEPQEEMSFTMGPVGLRMHLRDRAA